jgi:hypothetical protein
VHLGVPPEVACTVEVRGRDPLAPVARMLTRLAPYAVRGDLRRAGRILEGRRAG